MNTSPFVSSTPIFGRAWNLQVLSAAQQTGPSSPATANTTTTNDQQTLLQISSNAWEPEALRITFEVEQLLKGVWWADIAIYNLDLSTVKLISQGAEVSLAAGYQSQGQPTEIFRGVVFQPLWERENVVDTKLTLRCCVALDEIKRSWVNYTSGAVSTQWQLVQKMASSCSTPISIAYLDPEANFKSTSLPRSKTIFGTPDKLFAQIADSENMVSFSDDRGLNFGRLENPGNNPDIVFAPPLAVGQQPQQSEASITRSIVGVPQQTQYGADLRVFLDNRVRLKLPAMQIKLDNTVIRQAAFQPGGAYSSILSQDGVYIVAGVRHIGDSRGNPWYTEITGLSSVNGRLAMMGVDGTANVNAP